MAKNILYAGNWAIPIANCVATSHSTFTRGMASVLKNPAFLLSLG
jgi:hypothetical protein